MHSTAGNGLPVGSVKIYLLPCSTRDVLQAQSYSCKEGRGDMWLFFGCRHHEQDWIFREEMEGFLKKGTLARLSIAFSRDSAEKVYVQVCIFAPGLGLDVERIG